MGNKLHKVKTLINKKAKVTNAFRQIIYDEKIKEIIDKYRIEELTAISPAELFRHFNNYSLNETLTLVTDFMNGSSPLIDYFFLCHFAKALKIRKYFEIGTWVGLSAYNISANTVHDTDIYTLDIPFDHPEIQAFDIPVNLFGHHSKNIPNISHLKGDSINFDFSPYKRKMDMVFVDGNHSLEYVISDSLNALDMLKNDNSVILWHDYLLEGNLNKNVMCGILEAVPENEHKHLFYIFQSNMAIYCRTIDFAPGKIGKWEIPEIKYQVTITPK
jgi:predicted O-methyltransferase YrrM